MSATEATTSNRDNYVKAAKTIANAISGQVKNFAQTNNQDTVILHKFVRGGLLCLFHDNRIYAFRRVVAQDDSSTQPRAVEPSVTPPNIPEKDMLLDLMTIPRYRALNAMYFVFRVLDNASFFLLLVLSIFNAQLTVVWDDVALYGTMALDAFNSVMSSAQRYWPLQRLNPFIGGVLFAIYYAILFLLYNDFFKGTDTEKKDQKVKILIILSVRLAAFLFEEWVDMGIDIILHNDLCQLRDAPNRSTAPPSPDQTPPSLCSNPCRWFKYYVSVPSSIQLPSGVTYGGSFFAWSLQSINHGDKVWKTDPICMCLFWSLVSIPLVITIVLCACLFLLCIPAFALLLFFVGLYKIGKLVYEKLMNCCQRSGYDQVTDTNDDANEYGILKYFEEMFSF